MPQLPWNATERAICLSVNTGLQHDRSANDSPADRTGQIGQLRLNQRRWFTLRWLSVGLGSLLMLTAVGQSALVAEAAATEPEKTGPLIWRLSLHDARIETRSKSDDAPSTHYQVTIANGTGIHIRRLYLAGTLQRGASSKRGAFVWHVPGGLQVGKTALLDLSPALLGFLRGAPTTISVRDFKVEVIGFEDENGRIYGDFALR